MHKTTKELQEKRPLLRTMSVNDVGLRNNKDRFEKRFITLKSFKLYFCMKSIVVVSGKFESSEKKVI